MTNLDWIKQISPSILQLDAIPLFGNAPDFPWDKFSSELSNTFQIANIQITPQEGQWRQPDQLLEGIGSDPVFLYCSFSSLEGSLGWVMAKDDIVSLMQILLTKQPASFAAVDPDFEQGFYRFLAAQVIHSISKLEFDKNLSPNLHNETITHEQPAFCLDVSMALPEKTMMGRILLPPELLNSWKERYAARKLGAKYNTPLAQKLQVIVHLEAGRTELTQSEWAKVIPGDFIVLDFCSLEADADKGRIMMTIDSNPMFRARIKQGSIKILEFPLYHEVQTPMIRHTDEDEDEFEESEIEETEDEDFEEDEDFTEDEEFEEEESEIEEEEEEEEEIDLEEEEEEEKAQVKAKEPPAKAAAAPSPAPAAPAPAKKKDGVKPEELSLTIIIEVGRLQMSIQKLMELQPGNVLELDVHPENGVDLVVNGRCVGKGELLKVGETLGVRVLDIG